MTNPPTSTLNGLLLLIDRLQKNGQPLGRRSLVPMAEIKLPRVALHYDTLVGQLITEKLVEGDAENFVLSPAGADAVHAVAQEYSLHAAFYDEYYQAILHSQAHHLFCERVYGKDLGQHGMADMDQLHAMITELEIEPEMTLLDFGCGDGQISETIGEITQTRVTGVDISDQAIQLAEYRTIHKDSRIKFYVTDTEGKLERFSKASFDRIAAIDSIFFIHDQRQVTARLLNLLKPGGKMGVFIICPPQINANQTPFAAALKDLGYPFSVIDFSAENTEHWKKKKRLLLELESLFKAEGNKFLFKNRMAECNGLDSFHRFLYTITKA